MIQAATKEFKAPVRWEGSWGASKFTKPVDHSMTLYFEDELTALIEWYIEAIDHVETLGLWFERNDDGKLVLIDWDGAHSFPNQAVEMLTDYGIVVPEDVV